MIYLRPWQENLDGRTESVGHVLGHGKKSKHCLYMKIANRDDGYAKYINAVVLHASGFCCPLLFIIHEVSDTNVWINIFLNQSVKRQR